MKNYITKHIYKHHQWCPIHCIRKFLLWYSGFSYSTYYCFTNSNIHSRNITQISREKKISRQSRNSGERKNSIYSWASFKTVSKPRSEDEVFHANRSPPTLLLKFWRQSDISLIFSESHRIF